MSTSIAATVFAALGIAAPFGLLPNIRPTPFMMRCFAAWVLTALFLFFLDNQMLILLLSGFLLLILAPSAPVERICFFFVTIPCLPTYLQFYVPFPGINWLVLLTHYKIVVLVLLLPLLFRPAPNDGQPGGLSTTDACVLLYVAITTLLITAFAGFTAGPRFLIDQLLLFIIPYFALSRGVRNPEDLDSCFRAILFASLILAAIALVSTLKQWDFYRYRAPATVFTIPDLRSGFIRIEATANTHSLGYHLALGVIMLEYLKRPLALGLVRLWIIRGALLAGIFVTDSRGAMLGLAVAFVAYAAAVPTSKALRRTLLGALVVAAVSGFVFLVSGDASEFDTYGSISYRQALITISVAHILKNPLFGDMNFLADPSFAPLMQGQGIIDITNFYLQIGLQFGLVGLGLILAIVIGVLRGLFHVIDNSAAADTDETKRLRRMSAVLFAAIIGWLALMATTSDVGLSVHLGLILLALGRAVSMMAPRSARERAPVEARPSGAEADLHFRRRL